MAGVSGSGQRSKANKQHQCCCRPGPKSSFATRGPVIGSQNWKHVVCQCLYRQKPGKHLETMLVWGLCQCFETSSLRTFTNFAPAVSSVNVDDACLENGKIKPMLDYVCIFSLLFRSKVMRQHAAAMCDVYLCHDQRQGKKAIFRCWH